MRAQHSATADEIDYLHGSQGTPERRRRTKRASVRKDRRNARQEARSYR
jgi:hypothetical protein